MLYHSKNNNSRNDGQRGERNKMADKKYNVRTRKDFGEKTGLDRTIINEMSEGELAGGEEFADEAAKFEEDQGPANTL